MWSCVGVASAVRWSSDVTMCGYGLCCELVSDVTMCGCGLCCWLVWTGIVMSSHVYAVSVVNCGVHVHVYGVCVVSLFMPL